MTSRQVTGTVAAGLASWRNGKRKGRTQSMIGHPHIRGSWFRRAEPPQDDRTAGAASFYPRTFGREPAASGWAPRILRRSYAVPAHPLPQLLGEAEFRAVPSPWRGKVGSPRDVANVQGLAVHFPTLVLPPNSQSNLRRRWSGAASPPPPGID